MQKQFNVTSQKYAIDIIIVSGVITGLLQR